MRVLRKVLGGIGVRTGGGGFNTYSPQHNICLMGLLLKVQLLENSDFLLPSKYLKQNKYRVTLTDTMQQEPHI